MEIVDSGVLPPSFMDFTLPSAFAQQALYYVPQFGHFYCDGDYRVARDTLEQCLLIYVCDGVLHLTTGGRKYTAAAGQVALLDCRQPHAYGCDGRAEFLWFHFSGGGSRPYAALLYEQAGVVFDGEAAASLRRYFDRVLSCAQVVPSNEHLISLYIAQILTRLAAPAPRGGATGPVAPALACIREQYGGALSLETLAQQCHLSPSHFIRSFARCTGRTPHEYLLAYRLRQAKRMLTTTGASIEEIAARCGFNSASHFARAFRKSNGMSPTDFRAMQF